MSDNITSEQLSALAVKFKESLAEADAELFDQSQATYVSLLGDAELPRHWPELSPDAIPDAIDYMNLVTSVKNKVPCKYVDDPMASREVYRGRWRQAFIRRVMQGDVTKLVQVLRRGYAEQINWDEARIRNARWLQDQPTGTTSDYERYIEVYWPNCSISKLNAMVNSLNERTYPNPVIEGEARTGTWRNLGVTTAKADDGSGIITMSLAISHFRLDVFTNWLTHHNENLICLFGYSKDEAQVVIDAWKGKGHGVSVAYRKEEGLVDLVLRARDFDQEDVLNQTSSWDCRYKVIIDYHFGVSNPELYPLTTTPVDGISYDRQLRDNGDGSWDILIITRNVQYRELDWENSASEADSLTQTKRQLGLTTQSPESVVAPTLLTDGVAMRQVAEVRDDCSKDVITEKETTQYREIDFATSAVDGRNKVQIKRQIGLTTQTPEPLPEPAALDDGTSMRQRVDVRRNNAKDIETEKQEVQYRDIPYQVSEISADTSEETRQQLGLTTQTQESMASENGVIKRQVVEVRDDCSKDVITKKETVSDIEKSSYDNDGLVHRAVTDHSAASSVLPEEVPAQGQAIQVVNERTPYPGKTRTRRIVEESQAITGVEYVSHYGERSTEYTIDVEHDLAAPAITDQTASGIETAVLSHNLDKFLTHNYRKLRSVKKFPFSGEGSWVEYGDVEMVTTQAFSATLGRYWNDRTYAMRKWTQHAVKYFRTEAEANAFLEAGGSILLPGRWGSNTSHTGEFEYRAHLMVHNSSEITHYDYDEPLS